MIKNFHLTVFLYSFDSYYLKRFLNFFNNYSTYLKNFFKFDYKMSSMPIKRSYFTVLRSPHVNKTARDQFELQRHKKVLKINI